MIDQVSKIGESIIQHGPLNHRVYLMHVDPGEVCSVIDAAESLADTHGYSKIFGKVTPKTAHTFEERGFETEALIPPQESGQGGLAFVSKFLSDERAKPTDSDRVAEVIRVAKRKSKDQIVPALPPSWTLEEGRPIDAEEIADLYREVFETYPFPIQDPEYIAQCMEDNVGFFAVWQGNTLIAVSSAERDPMHRTAEMTDFAVRIQNRGRGLAELLLAKMDMELRRRRYVLAFTIARATSFGMNITFAKRGYRHAGTLTNNTNISGGLESMNIWYKHL